MMHKPKLIPLFGMVLILTGWARLFAHDATQLKSFASDVYQVDFTCRWKKATGLWNIIYAGRDFGGLNFLRASYRNSQERPCSLQQVDTMAYEAAQQGRQGVFRAHWKLADNGKTKSTIKATAEVSATLAPARMDITCQARSQEDAKLNRYQRSLFTCIHVFKDMGGWTLYVKKADGTSALSLLPEQAADISLFRGRLQEMRLSKDGQVLVIKAGCDCCLQFHYYSQILEIHLGDLHPFAASVPAGTECTWSYSMLFDRE